MKKHLMPVCIHLSATPSVAWSLVAHSSTNASTATMTAEAYARPLMYSNWQQPFYSKILFRILRWRLNNLTDAPQVCLDFMKQVPTTWDENKIH